MTEVVCPTCGTRSTVPLDGSLLCPNNNCPRHTAASTASTAGPLRQRIANARQEAETWDLAVKRAEAALEAARQNAATAHARITETIAQAQEQAEAELAAIKGMRHPIKLAKGS